MKRQFFWIVELFIWLLLLFFVAGGIMFLRYNYKKNFNTYQIFLPDVDGLINGSPVRLMGIQIGYVNQINIVGEDVYVRFIITNPNAKVPRGTRATVEFSGLGGSKSLELYTPNSNEVISDKFIIAQNPKRIHESLGLLNDMFNKLMNIIYTTSHFMNEVGIIQSKNVPNNPQAVNEVLNYSNQWLDNALKEENKIAEKLKKKKGGKNEQRQSTNN